MKVPRGDRSGAILEPYLTKQWFVKTEKLAKPALEAVENKIVNFVPDNWKNTYYSWMKNIQDWCISRQLWWGHRIPVWYDDCGNMYVATSKQDAYRKYNLNPQTALIQDNDVFDTWFSSALWPFSTLGWPDETIDLKKYYPTSVLVTGFDIIFFWVARMMMFGIYFMKEVPFRHIYITGLIRDAEGQKMSKSKGNVLDPVDLIDGISLEDLVRKRTKTLMQPKMRGMIEKATRKYYPDGIKSYGADALRFTFTALASTSRDICFDVSRMEGYRNFCNKLWNASRFVTMNMKGYDKSLTVQLDQPGIWIWHQFNIVASQVHKYIADYRFDLLAQTLYEFVWNQYCDWYLEFAKATLADTIDKQTKNGIQYTLIEILHNIIKLLHPVIPFITETIYQEIKPYVVHYSDSIMTAAYPVFDNSLVDEKHSQDIEWLKNIILTIRALRSEMSLKPSQLIEKLYVHGASKEQKNTIIKLTPLISLMAKVKVISFDSTTHVTSTKIIDNLELSVPLEGLVDIKTEKDRLNKNLQSLRSEINRIDKKLSNVNFIKNAPNTIVDAEKQKRLNYHQSYEKLASQLQKISTL